MGILQDRVIDKLIKKIKPIVVRLFVVIRYDIVQVLQKNFEVVNYCIICCNKKVIASTYLLQYVEFIAMRFLCCVNLFP